MTVVEKLRDGDVYRWRYREPDPDRDGAYGRYHCCSNIAIVRNGKLRDTFWGSGNGGMVFGDADVPLLTLTHLGNLADLEKASEYQADYFDDADIVDLNHSNSTRGNFYLRKGAKRSQSKMLAKAKQRLEDSTSAELMAAKVSELLHAAIADIESGKLDISF